VTTQPATDPSTEPERQPSEELRPDTAQEGAEGRQPLALLVGAGLPVRCLDGTERPYRDLDCAASSPASVAVAAAVAAFLPEYSSVHRGAGYKSRASTVAYEQARERILEHGGSAGGDDIAVICRNTT
jgi:hypothetical protein